MSDFAAVINDMLSGEPFNTQVIYDYILTYSRQQIAAERGQLLLVTPDRDGLTIHATTGDERIGTYVSLASFCGEFIVKRGLFFENAPDLSAAKYDGFYVPILGGKTLPMRSELAVGVRVGDNTVAVLNFESPAQNAFDDDDVNKIIDVAQTTAVALRFASEITRRQELERIREAEEAIQAQISIEPFVPNEVYDKVLQQTLVLLDAGQGQLLLVYPDRLVIHATTGQEAVGTIVEGDSFCSHFIVDERNPFYIADDLNKPEFKRYFKDYLGKSGPAMRSELAVAVYSGQNLIAIINLESPNPGEFEEADARLLMVLAHEIAVTLIRATDRSFEDDLARIVVELSEENVTNKDWLNEVCRRACELVWATEAHYIRVENEVLTIQGSYGAPPPVANLLVDNCIPGQAVKTKQFVLVDDVSQGELLGINQSRSDVGSEIAVPLMIGGGVIAVLHLRSPRVGAFTMRHAHMLTQLAEVVALGSNLRDRLENHRSVLHYIKNMLTFIETTARQVEEDIVNHTLPRRADVQKIRREADDLRRAAERRTRNPKILPLPLGSFLEQLGHDQSVGVDLSGTDDSDLLLVLADEDMLLQTLNLLIDNSRRFVAKAEREREIITLSVEREQDIIRILVTDNGTGIPDKDLPRIFDPQVSGSGGSGLGLPDARYMMHMVNGRIYVHPTYMQHNEGCRMVLELREMRFAVLVQKQRQGGEPFPVYLCSTHPAFSNGTGEELDPNLLSLIEQREPYRLNKALIDRILEQPSLVAIDFASDPKAAWETYSSLAQRIDRERAENTDLDQCVFDVYVDTSVPVGLRQLQSWLTNHLNETGKGCL